MNRRLAAIAVAGGLLTSALTGCSSVGPTMADAMPVWAGGLSKDAPPRPGTPEYEEFRRSLTEPKPAANPRSQAAQSEQPETKPEASRPAGADRRKSSVSQQ